MSRNAVLIRAATAALLLFTTLVILQPHIEAWFADRDCVAEGGRWNENFQGCETIREASPTASA